jgi:hypothetical protein
MQSEKCFRDLQGGTEVPTVSYFEQWEELAKLLELEQCCKMKSKYPNISAAV